MTSIRPLASAAGLASGSSRKARRMPPSSGCCGSFRLPSRPELVEVGAGRPCFASQAARRLVEMLQPLPCRAALGEGLARAQALGEIGEDRVVVARLAVGLGDRMHRHHQRVVGGCRRCPRAPASWCRAARCRHGAPSRSRRARARPACRPGEGAAQAVEVLVVVEGVAAGPVDQRMSGRSASRRCSDRSRRGSAACRRCARPG
jgi:hypothetical protein